MIEEIEKIYIDMDGVLSDFDEGLIRILNMMPMPQGNQPQSYQEKMWAGLRDYGHFYRDLIPLEGAIEGFNYLFDKYGDKCEILTGIPKASRGCGYSTEDKITWVRKYLNDEVKINTVLRADKASFCKSKACILIDDYGINITEWESNGGTGILFTSWDEVKSLL